jgi:hypothetical protein
MMPLTDREESIPSLQRTGEKTSLARVLRYRYFWVVRAPNGQRAAAERER